jgi:hypothetical protein
VPGRKPADAVHAYLRPLQQSLSCFTNKVLRPSGFGVDQLLVATFFGTTVQLRTRDSKELHLGFVQHFSIRSYLLGGYKITTRLYEYSLENEYGHEIVAFHWHPESENSTVSFAHMHLGHGSADRLRKEMYDIHFPTPRMAFEEIGLLLLDHFNVEPEREDARDVLNANLALFTKHKTW